MRPVATARREGERLREGNREKGKERKGDKIPDSKLTVLVSAIIEDERVWGRWRRGERGSGGGLVGDEQIQRLEVGRGAVDLRLPGSRRSGKM